MFTVYGSPMCPDCRACKANFDHYGVAYTFVDVCASLKDLRQFLIYRDTLPVFDRLKAIHDIGLPAVVAEDGTVFTDWEGWLAGQGLPVLADASGSGAACSLDHKGC